MLICGMYDYYNSKPRISHLFNLDSKFSENVLLISLTHYQNARFYFTYSAYI